MKKIITIFIFSFLTIQTFSQTKSGNELVAEGIAKTKIKPDLANFKITFTKQNTIEKTAIKDLNQEIEKLQNVLFKLGFTEKNVKISEYKISKDNYENRKEFSATNTLSVDFVLDNKRIEGFYQEIQNENLQDVDIEFETQISENLEKTTRQKLVQNAIIDAKNNAENIATALNVKINNVKQVSKYNLRDITYSSIKMDEVKFLKPRVASEMMNPKTSFDKFEVMEVELEETINIVYEIANK
ncbi:SIMPL domain-containing protein [Flavobacterium sp. P4023]|uniref:SIMPL domain-containing protein n=1 Tax=Flavobacterium flabelliforme TaxID=2816119 RepID=A0ABS5CTE7_9FLAO|nr:SIMPL domain-containing protein [Flavobacterium flabelliforme]MBP4141894.1 SIMPL domain-containing protein [Flavobacterium flabelliforme]